MSRLIRAHELVAISSVSRHESELASVVEQKLRGFAHLRVERIGDNVIATTNAGFARRVLVAGHLDTVPGDASLARVDGKTLHGVGACDMKGSLSVMLELAATPPTHQDVSWVFYAREEIARSESGLVELAQLRPDLIQADVAVVAEPTGGTVEAGCQGTLRVAVTFHGRRAHTARPFTGDNAVHRLGTALTRIAAYEPRSVEIDGVVFVEQMQAVSVSGGIAPNVVPDVASVTINHRVAPDRSRDEAIAQIRRTLGDCLRDGDEVVIEDFAPPARPHLDDPMLADLVRRTGVTPRAKVGWTDVATFTEMGVPATNFGAGDPLLAHRSDEFVTEDELDVFAGVLASWLVQAP